jgi:hypothetical protein
MGKARTRRERKRCGDRRLITSLKRTGRVFVQTKENLMNK